MNRLAPGKTASLPNAEIDRRAPVWRALADLFLDTELLPSDFERIALVIFKAGLSLGKAEQILLDEVAPAFIPNALSVAGEWAGWSEEFVKERVLAHLNAGAAQRAIARFRARQHRTLYVGAWEEVARHLTQIQHIE